jgi:hypothetical protein
MGQRAGNEIRIQPRKELGLRTRIRMVIGAVVEV